MCLSNVKCLSWRRGMKSLVLTVLLLFDMCEKQVHIFVINDYDERTQSTGHRAHGRNEKTSKLRRA
jgi:hypothetical protein